MYVCVGTFFCVCIEMYLFFRGGYVVVTAAAVVVVIVCPDVRYTTMCLVD